MIEPRGRAEDLGDLNDRLRAQLFDRRVVLLRGPLDDRRATQVAAELMTLDAEGDEAVTLQVDSAGGTLEAAFMVIDTIDLLGVPVRTVCLGRAEGPAVGIVAVGEGRTVAPHARFRLQVPVATYEGPARQVEGWARQSRLQEDRFVARLAQATGRPDGEVAADLESGRYLDAGAAIAYGLVDALWTGRL